MIFNSFSKYMYGFTDFEESKAAIIGSITNVNNKFKEKILEVCRFPNQSDIF